MSQRIQFRILISIAVFFIGLAVLKNNPLWIEHYYVQKLYPHISYLNQRLWSWVPFSVGDIGYGLGIVMLARGLIRFSLRKHFWKSIAIIGILVALFYTSWGLHYFKTPMRVQRELPDTLSVDHLLQTTHYYAEQTTLLHNILSKSVSQKVITDLDNRSLLALATETMEHTPFRPEKLHGRAKATLFPTLLSYMGFGGYANPFTHEAQVNTLQPKLRILTTACHEIAHQWGFAAEDEANYISIKATTKAQNSLVAYAGNLLAFQHLINSLYRADQQHAKEIMTSIPEGVLANIREGRAFWERYQNPFEPLFETGYDQYLKANHQQAGIQSYSLVVGLLVDDFIRLK